MPLYEFVLRVPGENDEVRISDRSLIEGAHVRIGNRDWIVVARETNPLTRPGGQTVAARFVLVPLNRSTART